MIITIKCHNNQQTFCITILFYQNFGLSST